ncbi:hypothetical protein GCM10027040_27140 [Halomonas shantousis]
MGPFRHVRTVLCYVRFKEPDTAAKASVKATEKMLRPILFRPESGYPVNPGSFYPGQGSAGLESAAIPAMRARSCFACSII